ncbi:MAG: MFS transporter [Rudaea sp.]
MTNSLRALSQSTFSSLRIRNYRLYYIGQIISTSGTFMQSIAQAWLVLKLTNSGTALGLVSALQFLPVLLLSPFGGVIADRFPKRTLLYITQSAFGVLALLLGLAVATGIVQLWMVEIVALGYGLVNTVDNPTRQSFVVEMVGESELRNAVTLYSSLVNLARVIGPAIAAAIIAAVQLAPCFILNGVSYGAVLIMLFAMRASELHTAPLAPRARSQLVQGFRYVASTPVLRNVLVMLAIIGTLTFEFQVSLPLLAQFTFNGDASSYAALTSAMGLGAVAGGLLTAGQKELSPSLLIVAAFFFGVTTLIAGAMPSLALAVMAMLAVGIFSIYFTSLGNSILQVHSEPQMRGRVMAFWAIAFLGSTTIGGPVIGWVGQTFGARAGLGLGGAAAIVAAVYGLLTLRHLPPRVKRPAGVAAQAEAAAEQDLRVQ